MNALMTVALLAPLASAPATGIAGEDARSGGWSDLHPSEILEKLSSSDANQRAETAQRIRARRFQTVSALYQVATRALRDPSQELSAKTAMLLLGELGGKEAIPLLLDNIKFTVRAPASGLRGGYFRTMPAVDALIDIGLPSLDPLVKRVADSDDEVTRERAAIVVAQVLGADLGLLFVRDRQQREANQAKRDRLGKLSEQIDTVERQRRMKIGPLRPPPEVKAPVKQ